MIPLGRLILMPTPPPISAFLSGSKKTATVARFAENRVEGTHPLPRTRFQSRKCPTCQNPPRLAPHNNTCKAFRAQYLRDVTATGCTTFLGAAASGLLTFLGRLDRREHDPEPHLSGVRPHSIEDVDRGKSWSAFAFFNSPVKLKVSPFLGSLAVSGKWTSPRLAGAELRVYSPAGGFTHGDGATDFHSGI